MTRKGNDSSGTVITGIRKRRRRRRQRLSTPLLVIQWAVVFGFLAPLRLVQSEKCSVCGILGPATVPLPDKTIAIDGIPVDTCRRLETTVMIFEEDSDLCRIVQSIGTLCGCNKPPNACNLCWDGSQVTNNDLELLDFPTKNFLPTANEFDTFLTCETLEAVLHSVNDDNPQCLATQIRAGETCGCPQLPEEMLQNATTITTTEGTEIVLVNNNSSSNTKSSSSSEDRCTLCPFGEPVPFPDKELNVVRSTSYTCRDWDAGIAGAIAADSEDCKILQTYAHYCGCRVASDACTMCPNGEPVPKPNQPLNWYKTTFVSTETRYFHSNWADSDLLTCDMIDSTVKMAKGMYQTLFGMDDDLYCMAVQLKSWICGCSPDWRQILLTWSYRTSGMLSFLGSFVIICDIALRAPRQHNGLSTYHGLMLGISFFDCFSSFAYMMVGVMAPYEAGFYLSRGNDATCKAQGFLIQLGHTSMFYNLCLSVYFLLIIVCNWKERRFQKLHWQTHAAVLTVGIGMAVGALPYIAPQFGVCGILPPLTATQWQVSLFYTAPVSTVLVTITVSTFWICWHVYQKQKKVQQWMADQRLQLTRKVFWQSFWYVTAFYVTLPFVLVTFYLEFKIRHHFWLLVFAAILAPLQGLMNALVYFQRSIGIRRLCRMLRRCQNKLRDLPGFETVTRQPADDDDDNQGGNLANTKPSSSHLKKDSVTKPPSLGLDSILGEDGGSIFLDEVGDDVIDVSLGSSKREAEVTGIAVLSNPPYWWPTNRQENERSMAKERRRQQQDGVVHDCPICSNNEAFTYMTGIEQIGHSYNSRPGQQAASSTIDSNAVCVCGVVDYWRLSEKR